MNPPLRSQEHVDAIIEGLKDASKHPDFLECKTVLKEAIVAGDIPGITDPEFVAFEEQVPGGAYAQAAIYSEHAHHLAVLRKILLRMSSWMNYVFPLH